MIKDTFSSTIDSVIAPASNCFALVPSDAEELAVATKAIYVGDGGNIVLRSLSGVADVVFANVPSGSVIDVRARYVRATGTTATSLVGLA